MSTSPAGKPAAGKPEGKLASRAAEVAAPSELSVPVDGELMTYPDHQDELTSFLSTGGVVTSPWAALRTASSILASRGNGVSGVELWSTPDTTRPARFALLARYTSRGRGQAVPSVRVIGAARVAEDEAPVDN